MHSFKIERAQIVLRQIHTRTALTLSLPHKAKDIWCVHVIDKKKVTNYKHPQNGEKKN